MGRRDYLWVYGGKLRTGMSVLGIGGNARDSSVPEGVGVVEEITDITAASPSCGKEYFKLHLKEVKRGTERTRFACKTKLFLATVRPENRTLIAPSLKGTEGCHLYFSERADTTAVVIAVEPPPATYTPKAVQRTPG